MSMCLYSMEGILTVSEWRSVFVTWHVEDAVHLEAYRSGCYCIICVYVSTIRFWKDSAYRLLGNCYRALEPLLQEFSAGLPTWGRRGVHAAEARRRSYRIYCVHEAE
jgi:hypothetical protein